MGLPPWLHPSFSLPGSTHPSPSLAPSLLLPPWLHPSFSLPGSIPPSPSLAPPPLPQLLLQLALRPHPPPQQRALLPLAGIFVAAAVYIYMVGAQKPPEIGNTRINPIIHDKVIISSTNAASPTHSCLY